MALGSGKRPFVVAGDGGFMMICQELSSLAREHCNAVIFVISSFIGGPQQCGAIGWKTISPVHFGFVAFVRKSCSRCTPSFRK